MERIVTEKRSFVDEYGRERIFYGVNIVDKRKNSEDNKFGFNIDDKLLDEMTSRGLNLIRLGTTWSMIEPEPGSYNDEYLDDMYRIFDLCAAHGVYILFDKHQDRFSALLRRRSTRLGDYNRPVRSKRAQACLGGRIFLGQGDSARVR